MGLKKIPVLSFDYHLDNIDLSHRCRVTSLHSLGEHTAPFEELVSKGVLVELEDVRPGDIKEENDRPIIACGEFCYTFREYHDVPAARLPPKERDYELSKLYLEVDSDDLDQRTEYLGFEQAQEHLGAMGKIVVFPRKLSKIDVIKVVWDDRVFPRKTTRHVFSFRVFNHPIKLSMLCENGGSLKEDLKAVVLEKGRKLHLVYLGRHVRIAEDNNRYYEEPMFKFVWGDADHAGH